MSIMQYALVDIDHDNFPESCEVRRRGETESLIGELSSSSNDVESFCHVYAQFE